VAGGGAGRRAAVRGTVAIGVTSALVNLHTGVHYPGDVVVGSLIGEGTGQAWSA
jgi:hypothetical protein